MDTDEEHFRAPVSGSIDRPAELERDWPFAPSRAPFWMVKARVKVALRRSVAFPRSAVLKAEPGPGPWALYFVYAPNGVLEYQHLFCLEKLRAQGFSVLVVAAGMTQAVAAETIGPHAEGVIWKALPGFDFSAYSLGLWWLARHARGSDVFVLNDSVFGPFCDVHAMLQRTPWRLTGFTASGVKENHLQSYAFMIRKLTPAFLFRLGSVFNTMRSFDRFDDVVLCQELRLGRLAARFTSVGALWFAAEHDATLLFPAELIAQGFPFIKRSLLGKHARFQAQAFVRAELEARGFTPP